MSKFYEAVCDDSGVVSVEGFAIPEAQLMSEGKAPSNGILLIERDKAIYLPFSVSDLKTTLEKVSAALQQVSTALQNLDAASIKAVSGGSGAPAVGVTTPPAATGQISQINSIKSELDALKDGLK